MVFRRQWEERERQWREFHAEEADLQVEQRDASAVLADLSFLLRLVPAEQLLEDPDPEKLGIGRMRSALAAISRS